MSRGLKSLRKNNNKIFTLTTDPNSFETKHVISILNNQCSESFFFFGSFEYIYLVTAYSGCEHLFIIIIWMPHTFVVPTRPSFFVHNKWNNKKAECWNERIVAGSASSMRTCHEQLSVCFPFVFVLNDSNLLCVIINIYILVPTVNLLCFLLCGLRTNMGHFFLSRQRHRQSCAQNCFIHCHIMAFLLAHIIYHSVDFMFLFA